MLFQEYHPRLEFALNLWYHLYFYNTDKIGINIHNMTPVQSRDAILGIYLNIYASIYFFLFKSYSLSSSFHKFPKDNLYSLATKDNKEFL